MSIEHLSNTKFSELNLAESLAAGLKNSGFEFCTPIQAQAIPHLLAGQDVGGQAQTGTGKTIAFLVAVIQRLIDQPGSDRRRANQPRALILAPTRELAVQIHKDAELLVKNTGIKLGLAYGGANYDGQRTAIQEGVDILIGTPGRLIDFFKQKIFDLKAIQAVVLDEADRMFDLGFIKDVRFMFNRMPEPGKRLSMLFSATLSYRVIELAYEHMNNPELVKIESEFKTAEKIIETVHYTANDEKIPLLIGTLRALNPFRTIIFVNTKRSAEKISAYLQGNGFQSGLLSGDIPQKKRQRLLDQIQKGELPILVATDVAARGLHIDEVSHVINFDLPQNAEDYVHRIGRTGRAGASGVAISFACEDYAFYLPDIEEYIGHKINAEAVDPALLAELSPPAKIERAKPKQHAKRPPRNNNRNSNNRPKHHHKPKSKPQGDGNKSG